MRAACLDCADSVSEPRTLVYFGGDFQVLYGLLLCKNAGLDYNRDR